MVLLMRTRASFAFVLGCSFLAISEATPTKAIQTVEIDGKGAQKASAKEVQHDVASDSHGHAHDHDKKTSKYVRDERKAKESAHKANAETPEAKGAKHPQEAEKKNEVAHGGVSDALKEKAGKHSQEAEKTKGVAHGKVADASLAEQGAFSDEEEEDAALDELEAMTIARVFERKRPPPWGPPPAEPCKWLEWENDGSCAFTCGGRGKTGQKMTRGKIPAKHGGSACAGKDSKSVECAIETCPTTTTTTEEEVTTTTAGGASRMTDSSGLALWASLACVFSLIGN